MALKSTKKTKRKNTRKIKVEDMIGLVRDQVIAQGMKGQILGSVETIVTTKREEILDPVVVSEIWLKCSKKTR